MCYFIVLMSSLFFNNVEIANKTKNVGVSKLYISTSSIPAHRAARNWPSVVSAGVGRHCK